VITQRFKVIGTNSITFERKQGELIATLSLQLSSWLERKYEAQVDLFDKSGKALAHKRPSRPAN